MMMPRPVLIYQGGKYRIAPWVISYFPPHDIYLEPYGGAAGILMNKPRSNTEIYNDLDSNILNVFRVLQDREKAKELEYRLRYTPYSRDEWLLASDKREGNDDIDTARRTIIRAFMSMSADGATRTGRGGFGLKIKGYGRDPTVTAWQNYPDCIKLFTERLQGVVLENKDALKLIPFVDSPHTLLYVDPPYMPSTWCAGSYKHLASFESHKNLIDILQNCAGMVVLSGYDNEYYRDNLVNWEKHIKETYNQKSEKRVECLWLNPQCQKRRTSKQFKLW